MSSTPDLIPSPAESAGTLVAGIDSSTQSCTVVVCDAATGELVRQGRAPHPDGTEVSPGHWWTALELAAEQAGGLADVAALSVGGQQHGMVLLDASGEVIRDALLWNDTRSAEAALDLIAEPGEGDPELGAARWAEAIGVVPVASITITKLRWLADHEPEAAARVAAICLPHDWLTWQLAGAAGLDQLTTDRSDASGTGYFDPVSNQYRRDLLALALRREVDQIVLPRVVAAHQSAGTAARLAPGARLGAGAGDNAGAALGLGLKPGQVSVSIGTSGVVAAVSSTPTADSSGLVTGFADAAGEFLPLACTLNGARILDATAALLGVDHQQLGELALAAPAGSHGLTLVPWFEGERTPNLPTATATLSGATLTSFTRENLARAAVEGLLGLLAVGVDAVRAQGVAIDTVYLLGGAAKNPAVQVMAPALLGVTVVVPPADEYVARGAARQAAWALSGNDRAPDWPLPGCDHLTAEPQPEVTDQYRRAARAAQQGLPG